MKSSLLVPGGAQISQFVGDAGATSHKFTIHLDESFNDMLIRWPQSIYYFCAHLFS